MKRHELVETVERTIREEGLLQPGERFIAGVSGGPDSMALVHVLQQLSSSWDWKVGICHVNHQLRGKEAEEEEDYVAAYAAAHNIPCWIERVDVEAYRKRFTNNMQAAARTLRYEAFRRAGERFGTNVVGLAHHAGDQAETVLMRMLRGTGPGGLAGIRMRSEVGGLKLVRPLLRIRKVALEAYCAEERLEPRRDSSNDSRYYFRNVVRHEILPYLMKTSPQVEDSLRRLAETSADESDYLEETARSLLQAGLRETNDGWEMDRGFFLNAHIALQRRLIKIILNCLGEERIQVDFAKIKRIQEAIAADLPTTIELRSGHNLLFRRSYERLQWVRLEAGYRQESVPYELQLDVSRPGSVHLPDSDVRLTWWLEPADGSPARPRNEYTAIFDADRLPGTLEVRSRKPGDRVELLGLNGSKKVKDMFIDRKVPAALRELWPIVAYGESEIVWIPGCGRSRKALVDGRTRFILRMECLGMEHILR